MNDQSPPLPLSQEEAAKYRALIASGQSVDLGIIRRFIATIRKSITTSPTKTAKTKVSRNTKPVITEDQVDFF